MPRQPLALPTGPNQAWSVDFVMDALDNGRRLKCLTIVDDFTKESRRRRIRCPPRPEESLSDLRGATTHFSVTPPTLARAAGFDEQLRERIRGG